MEAARGETQCLQCGLALAVAYLAIMAGEDTALERSIEFAMVANERYYGVQEFVGEIRDNS
jgi:hypothetical protein